MAKAHLNDLINIILKSMLKLKILFDSSTDAENLKQNVSSSTVLRRHEKKINDRRINNKYN